MTPDTDNSEREALELPDLPMQTACHQYTGQPLYSAQQMRAYATDCAALASRPAVPQPVALRIYPVAWNHVMHDETGEPFQQRLTYDDKDAFGRPGVDFSETFEVKSQPLFFAASSPHPSMPGRPLFWVRCHPDGDLTDDLLSDAAIEPVRRASGAWLPLYRGAPDSAAPQSGAETEARAWEDADGFVISAKQKKQALADGGASARVVSRHDRPLYPPAPAVAQGRWVSVGEEGLPVGHGLSEADADRLKADANSIFNDPPSMTTQEVRDVIEWYDASIRAALASTGGQR